MVEHSSGASILLLLAAIATLAAPSAAQLPKGKLTTLGLYVTARQAYEMWKADSARVMILDVRTTEEFLFVGHAPMAWNIPAFLQIYAWDAAKQKFPMKLDPDFVAEVTKVAKPADTILVMCRSGGRSAMAVDLLAKAGYTHVYNITDGMEGDEVKDPYSVFAGQRLVNGWKNSGVPWTYDIAPARVVLPKSRVAGAADGDASGRRQAGARAQPTAVSAVTAGGSQQRK